MRCGALIGALFAFLIAAQAEAGPAFTSIAATPLPSDPTVHNGVRYAVMHVNHPKGAISIRLGIDVGSYEESDGERGVAHFIEHMAFRNTRAFLNNSVDGAFAPRGVAFGRDQNASTGLFSTDFQIDLPDTQDADIGRAFTWLRDVADGVVFDRAAVDTERGVVLAEKETRESAGSLAYDELLQFQAPGLRSFGRPPIGTQEVLRSVTPETLQTFYRRWYRPDNAVVVVTGDLPTEAMEARIRATFASWAVSGPMASRAPRIAPDLHRGLDTFVHAEAAIASTVDICKLQAPDPQPTPQDFGQVRKDALGQIWRQILNQRLLALHLQSGSQVLGAAVSLSDSDRDHRSICLTVTPLNDAWEPALAAAEAELLRFQKSGPTDREVERALDAVRSLMRFDITAAPNRTAPALADAVLGSLLTHENEMDPRQKLRAYDLAVEDVGVADIRAAFDRDWSGAGPLVSVMAPRVPSAAEVRTAWLTTERGAGLAAYADQTISKWGYTFTPGEVASREVIERGQFIRLRFKNGVVLNFKQTAFDRNSASFIVKFGEGRKEIANKDYLMANLGGVLVSAGGLGRHSYEDLGAMMLNDARTFQLHMGEDGFYIGGDESLPNLPDKLTVVAAYLLDPAFRPSIDPLLHETGELTYRAYFSSPAMTASMALVDTLAPDSPLRLPPKSTFMAMDSRRLADILKPAMTSDPLEISIVGDLDEKTAIRMVAGSLGALPARAAPRPIRNDIDYFRYPEMQPSIIRVQHQGPADQAVAELVWPLYVATPARRREEYSIRLLAAIFSDELRRRVRGELGKIYSPRVASQMPDHADQGSLTTVIEAYPSDIDVMIAEARAVAARLAAGGITAEALEAVKAPMLAQDRQALQTNGRWVSALAGSSEDDQSLQDTLGFSGLISAITLGEVKKASADWLVRAPIVVVSTPAKPNGQGSAP